MTPQQRDIFEGFIRIEKAAFDLRMAALAFAREIHGPVSDYKDSDFAVTHRKLQRAAVKYADALRLKNLKGKRG